MSLVRTSILACNEINAVGGYLGQPIELVVRNDEANNDIGLKSMRRTSC